jgi:hypothetical protein
MKGIQMVFEMMVEYQKIKFELKCKFEGLRVDLKIYYATKIKELHL